MAGSENKGVSFSRADLFRGATCIITPTAKTPPDVIEGAKAFWESLGMRTVRLTPSAHDRAVARISHLPHALASILMKLPGKEDLNVSATGFRDVTRLAGGDPEMWRDIFLTNRAAVIGAIDKFAHALDELREMISAGEGAAIEKLLNAAKKRRETTIAQQLQDRRISAE